MDNEHQGNDIITLPEKEPHSKLTDKMWLEQRAVNKWTAIKDRCVKKGHEFDLTVADVRRLVATRYCYYTGIDMQEAYNTGETHHCRSVDRVDSDQGYVKGNVVACSMAVNKLKSDLSLKELQNMVKRLEKREKAKKKERKSESIPDTA